MLLCQKIYYLILRVKMRILLDTHIYLWCLQDDRRLSKDAKAMIFDAEEVYVSSASIWEAAIKINIKKLSANINELISGITESGFIELSISVKHAALICNLPNYHRDPFDRILLAQAISEPLGLLTSDQILPQ